MRSYEAAPNCELLLRRDDRPGANFQLVRTVAECASRYSDGAVVRPMGAGHRWTRRLAIAGLLLGRLGLKRITDLSRVIVRTPSGGPHIYFTCGSTEAPRSRASDIARGLDTRGIGGGIIAPGNVLPDGRRYKLKNAADPGEWDGAGCMIALHEAASAPRELLYLAMFNNRERRLISLKPALFQSISNADSHEWVRIVQQWRDAEAASIADRFDPSEDADGYRAQACSDLRGAATEFAALTDGRRTSLFRIACKVAKYVHHGVLSEPDFRAAFMDAARANGALGEAWTGLGGQRAAECHRKIALRQTATARTHIS